MGYIMDTIFINYKSMLIKSKQQNRNMLIIIDLIDKYVIIIDQIWVWYHYRSIVINDENDQIG